jgi:hypothetical protein
MNDSVDNSLPSLPFEQKRGRGRPKTGQAMTPAEKQKAYRERVKASGNAADIVLTQNMKSVEMLRERALFRGRTCVAQARVIQDLTREIEQLRKELESYRGVIKKESE